MRTQFGVSINVFRLAGDILNITCNFMYCNHQVPSVLLTQYCAGGKIEKNEMSGACGTYGGGERCAQGSGGET